MSEHPRTIQIYLPKGDPRGLRIAALTTSIVQVIEIPRALLEDFFAMSESRQVGVYYLIGDNESAQTSSVYIGQTGALGERLSSHHKTKEFWNRALVAVSLTNSFTQTHALFLEWMSIKFANEVGRYSVENGNSGSKPHTPAPLEADCLDHFEKIRTLLATLGQPVFEPLARPKDAVKKDELFYCKAAGTDAVGEYTSEGFVILKGSKGRGSVTDSFKKTSAYKQWQSLLETGVVKQEGDMRVFQRDYLLKSPSQAARLIVGNNMNGWLTWKTESGKTLDELKRQDAVS
jgi:Domain of unknown function (DUF4357)